MIKNTQYKARTATIKMFLILVSTLFLMNFVSATVSFNPTTSISISESGTAGNYQAGVTITAKYNLTLINASQTISAGNLATNCGLYFSNGTGIQNTSFSGVVCPLNYVMTNGQSVRLLAYGTSFEVVRSASGQTLPTNNDQLFYNNSIFVGNAPRTDVYFVFTNISTDNSTTSIPTILVNLTSPSNNYVISTSSQNFIVNLSMSGTNYSYQWKNNTYNIWFNNGTLFNSTIVTGLSTNATSVSNLFNIDLGNYLWNSYACYRNATYSNCSWSYNGNYSFSVGFLISNVVYNANTIPTASETFLLQGTKTISTSSISAVLWYNGTSYPSTVTLAGNNVNITNSVTIPSGISGNLTFYWVITSFGTLGSTIQNSSTYNQTVGNLSIYACTSPPSSGLALNFTLYDEATKLKLNGSLENTFTYFAYGGSGANVNTYHFQSINESKNNWMFCINSSGLNVSFSGYSSYYADYYDRREYIFNNATVGNFTQNIPLYLSLIADTDVITVTVTDQNYNSIANALVSIQEWNVGTNTYSTVGMFYTDSDGNGIINLELYNIWYRAIVSKNGQILKVTDVKKLATTTWAINVETLSDNPYSLFGSISHGLVFDNNTNITTFSWLDNSGYVNYGCLEVRNRTNIGYDVVYTSCVSSVAGTINYLIVGDGEYEILGTIYLLPVYNVSSVTDTMSIRLGTPTLTSVVSPYGKVLSFIFIGVFALIGVAAGSPIFGIILLIISIFISGKLGWLNITQSIFWGLLSIAIVIVLRQTRRGS